MHSVNQLATCPRHLQQSFMSPLTEGEQFHTPPHSVFGPGDHPSTLGTDLNPATRLVVGMKSECSVLPPHNASPSASQRPRTPSPQQKHSVFRRSSELLDFVIFILSVKVELILASARNSSPRGQAGLSSPQIFYGATALDKRPECWLNFCPLLMQGTIAPLKVAANWVFICLFVFEAGSC